MTLIDTTTRKPRRKPANTSATPAATILAHPTADRIIASATRAASELAKLNAAMDKLMVAKGKRVIPAVRDLADQLIAFLDTSAGWDECEEEPEGDDSDHEPSLGAGDGMNQVSSWGNYQGNFSDENEGEDLEGDELDKLETSDLEISGEADGHNGGCVDCEPSLGSLDGRMSQKKWGEPDRREWWSGQDLELDEAEQEVGIEDQPHDADEFH
jgi:hypothetical protein